MASAKTNSPFVLCPRSESELGSVGCVAAVAVAPTALLTLLKYTIVAWVPLPVRSSNAPGYDPPEDPVPANAQDAVARVATNSAGVLVAVDTQGTFTNEAHIDGQSLSHTM